MLFDKMSFFDIILKKSNSFNYYKNNYLKLEKSDKKKQKKISNLENKLKQKEEKYSKLKKKHVKLNKKYKKLNKNHNKLVKTFDSFEDNFNHINDDLSKIKHINENDVDLSKKNMLINKEIHYGLIFKDTIKNSPWIKSKNFSLNNGAANYSFMYVLFRILDETSPKNILELGLGQTTKLTTQYANYFKQSKLLTVDGDESWINNFSDKLTIEGNINIVPVDLEVFNYDNTENLRYKNLDELIHDEKFDLIIIDGPQGFFSPGFKMLDYSRANIWDLIPNNLDDEFVIIIDDFERKGEKNTINVVKKLLEENNIEFYTFTSQGLKEQHVIASKDYSFVSWF